MRSNGHFANATPEMCVCVHVCVCWSEAIIADYAFAINVKNI